MSLGMRADIEQAPGAAALAQQVMRAWARNEARDFTAFVHSTLRIRPILDNEGKEIGRITGQQIDSQRIGPVVGRIARGLYLSRMPTGAAVGVSSAGFGVRRTRPSVQASP